MRSGPERRRNFLLFGTMAFRGARRTSFFSLALSHFLATSKQKNTAEAVFLPRESVAGDGTPIASTVCSIFLRCTSLHRRPFAASPRLHPELRRKIPLQTPSPVRRYRASPRLNLR